jgi:hypothetical protein
MSHRGILISLVALVLGVTSTGCASSGPDEDDIVAAVADTSSSHADLVSAVGLSADQQATLARIHAESARFHDEGPQGGDHGPPTLDQIVQWFTHMLGLTPEQTAKLRAYLEAHAPHGMPGPH